MMREPLSIPESITRSLSPKYRSIISMDRHALLSQVDVKGLHAKGEIDHIVISGVLSGVLNASVSITTV